MPYTIEVLCIGKDQYEAIEPVLNALNGAQTEFVFSTPSESCRAYGLPFVRKSYLSTDIWDFLGKYKVDAKGHRPYIIALLDGSLESPELGNLFGSSRRKAGLAAVTTQDFSMYAADLWRFVCYYMIRYALTFVAPDVSSHEDGDRECFFFKKMDKTDIRFSMEAGAVCDLCRPELEEQLNPDIHDAFNAMVEVMKQPVLTIPQPAATVQRTVLPQWLRWPMVSAGAGLLAAVVVWFLQRGYPLLAAVPCFKLLVGVAVFCLMLMRNPKRRYFQLFCVVFSVLMAYVAAPEIGIAARSSALGAIIYSRGAHWSVVLVLGALLVLLPILDFKERNQR